MNRADSLIADLELQISKANKGLQEKLEENYYQESKLQGRNLKLRAYLFFILHIFIKRGPQNLKKGEG